MPQGKPTIAQLKTRIRAAVGLLLAAVVCISAWGIIAERSELITASGPVSLLAAPGVRSVILQTCLTAALCLSVILLMQLLTRHLERLQMARTTLQDQQEQLRIKAEQIDAAHEAILLLDLEGRLLQVNNALCRMTGYAQEELLGIRLNDIEPPEYAARIAANIRTIQEKGQATFESAHLTKAGKILPVEVSARIMSGHAQPLILSIVRDISERKRSERRETTKSLILEKLATGVDLPELLLHIVRFVEQEYEGALCSVLLLDDSGTRLRHGAAPSLPDSYNQAVDGLRVGQGMGSCGTAAHTRTRVIVEDIEGHPYWKGFTPAREAGLRACWSEPVISAGGALLGTFAIYHREPRSPDRFEIQLIESAAHLASIAIDRHKADKQRKHLESQLHHIQKIEAVGQLAGGIAHDFNNLLTPIIGYAEMIRRKLPDGDPLSDKTQGIINAAGKARDLTKQLLSFGRKQVLQLHPVDLNEVVGSFHDILRRTIRANIAIDIRPSPGEVTILADRMQVEQILLNLAVNAQDAIEGNGSIVIESGHVMVDNEYARLHPGLATGRYALLAFSDSGCGMDDHTLGHIFEPFFTTKQIGHGTGLGLATVYGIVKQHDGYVAVNSRVGEGTAFRIFLPPCAESAAAPAETAAAAAPHLENAGGRTILVVEDNDMVREMVVDLLESCGYRVLVAALPSAAQELVRDHRGAIDLLVSDVVMPEINGQELYERLHHSLPHLRALYISGYAHELFANGTLKEGIDFLQKPFTAESFLKRVQQALLQDS
ncbi:PAS domain S-box protein [Geobacter sp. SVR]|uniref:PAS domain S-box protein n=1 Tax=Geobacter sp. SVR TaxID=2495594 RepID=UPI00143F04C8|nr:PAS domain S-box protein [Geobacter sp. SVR]BCS52484.1 hypothetical protein GSVR_07920 [Geobacter sp. SVR]GCF84079.1 histidine kinase [Geobacter sp. SVR]